MMQETESENGIDDVMKIPLESFTDYISAITGDDLRPGWNRIAEMAARDYPSLHRDEVFRQLREAVKNNISHLKSS